MSQNLLADLILRVLEPVRTNEFPRQHHSLMSQLFVLSLQQSAPTRNRTWISGSANHRSIL